MEGGKTSGLTPKPNIKCGISRSCIFHATAPRSPQVPAQMTRRLCLRFRCGVPQFLFAFPQIGASASLSAKARKEAWLLPWASGRSVPGHQLLLAWASGLGGCGSPTGKAPGEGMGGEGREKNGVSFSLLLVSKFSRTIWSSHIGLTELNKSKKDDLEEAGRTKGGRAGSQLRWLLTWVQVRARSTDELHL